MANLHGSGSAGLPPQDGHERRHRQIGEQTASDHFVKVLQDPEYWRNISHQEWNKNLATTKQLAPG